MAEPKKPTSSYAQKRKSGCEINHKRHPGKGIPWCELCQRENRH